MITNRNIRQSNSGNKMDSVRILLILIILCLLVFIFTTTSTKSDFFINHNSLENHDGGGDKRTSYYSQLRGPMHTVWGLSTRKELKIAIVADLDRLSLVSEAKKPTWKSIFKQGTLQEVENGHYEIDWEEDIELKTHLGEAGRGLELSELVTFQNKLYTFDDRSGVVFEIDQFYTTIPRYILMEGHGNTDKGQKTEWATVKDSKLYVGSFGKEFTNNDGSIKNKWNMWISIIDQYGQVTHEDWSDKYNILREATGAAYPGYMIHESIHFDDYNRQWIVMPRRVSSDPYDEKEDERKGSNLLLIVDEDFTKVIETKSIGPQVDLRGWSSFKFIPGTRNRDVIALKTEEQEDKTTGEAFQRSFITVFRLDDGEQLLQQQLIPGDHKYEGVEFL